MGECRAVKYKTRLEKLHCDYETAIEKVAEDALREVVKPFCDKHDLRFVSGNGTFILFQRDNEVAHHEGTFDNKWCMPLDDKIAKSTAPEGFQEVLDACNTPVPDCDGYGLYLFMMNYDPE